VRWFPADETLRETSMEKLMPPLVSQLRKKVKEFRDSGYVGASDTSKSLLNWWFKEPHLQPQADGTTAQFQYFFAQREALDPARIVSVSIMPCTAKKFECERPEMNSSGFQDVDYALTRNRTQIYRFISISI
jgi:hypothetical protein